MTTTTASSSRAPLELATTEFTKRFERRVLDFVRRDDVLNPGEKIVVAVSGGPDSTALLVALARLRGDLSLSPTAAHFNHLLRDSDETAQDLKFVQGVTSILNIPLVHAEGDVRARVRAEHESTEDAARHLRYAFLAQAATEADAAVVVTGHTIDDQAETVLLHLVRGAGLDGLAGMRPRSQWPFGSGPDLARPLLSLRRKDTQEYCTALGLIPRRDPTNDLPVAARNRLRREIMPALRRLNPSIEKAIARFAAAAAQDADYLDDLARHHFARVASVGPAAVTFARSDLLLANPAIAARLIRLAFTQVTGVAADLEAAHVEALLDSLGRPPGRLSLPDGVTSTTDARRLIIRRGETPAVARIPETVLAVPGRTDAGGYVLEAKVVPAPADPHQGSLSEALLDADRAGEDLTVRSRRPGDRLRPLGLGGEKKLQDLLVDAKIPARERDGVPIVCGPEGIVWVVGHCVDERFALSADSRQALHILFQPGVDR